MKILGIGSKKEFEELQLKFQPHECIHANPAEVTAALLNQVDLAFDFLPELSIHKNLYAGYHRPVFLNSVITPLNKLLNSKPVSLIAFGFCGLPTLINRKNLEVCLYQNEDESELKKICEVLPTAVQVVKDKAGMVTPQVICMIINEAYITLETEVASKADIDTAMKLGTNYPYGPFEWAERIGRKNVMKVLQAMHFETGNDRYMVSDLLKQEALHVTQA